MMASTEIWVSLGDENASVTNEATPNGYMVRHVARVSRGSEIMSVKKSLKPITE